MDAALPPNQVLPPHGLDGVRRAFGDITVAGGKIVAPKDWESRSMVMVSDLPGWGRRVYVNRAIVAPLRLALTRCVDLHDGYVIQSLGCFSPRSKRVNGDLSTHSWGIAIDLNPDTNPLIPVGGTIRKDIPDTWIGIFEAIGWRWGGRFSRPDPMHFQWVSGY